MRIRRGQSKGKDSEYFNGPVSEQTRSVLNNAVVNIVQAVGSKAGVLIFWDDAKHAPGQQTSYGLPPSVLEEVSPVIYDLVVQLQRQVEASAAPRSEEWMALQTEIATHQGTLQATCLPIQNGGQFVAGLCLLQPATLGLPLVSEVSGLLPPESKTGAGVIPVREEDEGLHQSQFGGLALDRNDPLARNARLLKRMVEERQWLAAIIEYSADGILIVDSDCNVIGCNPAFERLSGYSVTELRGQNCYEVLRFSATRGDAHCGRLCPVRLGTFINKPEEDRRSEVVLTTKDGEKRDVELTYSVILSDDRRILGGILGARDITARKEAEELQSTFLSVISHELQTPIAIIKGYAGLYSDETTKLDPVKVREKMQIIEEESDRLSKLVDNLLYASRLQAGGVELNRQPLDVGRLLRRVAQKMAEVSQLHPVSVASLDPELPTVSVDADKIEQVLVNLVENAIKYSPVGGPIILAAEHTSADVVVSVSDSGIGIPENERQRIFDRFSRLDSRYVRERKGAGLGLYICKAIVEAHGGHIWVESVGSEGGSRFRFTLPREEPAHLPVLFGKA